MRFRRMMLIVDFTEFVLCTISVCKTLYFSTIQCSRQSSSLNIAKWEQQDDIYRWGWGWGWGWGWQDDGDGEGMGTNQWGFIYRADMMSSDVIGTQKRQLSSNNSIKQKNTCQFIILKRNYHPMCRLFWLMWTNTCIIEQSSFAR